MNPIGRLHSLKAWIPLLGWLPATTTASLGLDFIAGLSLAAFVIPESIAYATLAGVTPVSGLYCYLVAGVAYAAFGTSRQVAVGPTSSLAVVVAASIAALGGGDPARVAALAAAIALLVGIMSIVGRFLRLATVAYFISDTMLFGFKSGAALYIASTQLPKLFGLHGGSGNFFERVWYVVHSLPQTHVPTLLVGVTAVALFLWLEHRFPGRPTTLIVVALSIVVTKVFDLSGAGVAVVGELPSGLPALSLPDLHLGDLNALLPTAFACLVLAYAEGISTARSFAQKHGYEIDPDQELTALGVANVAAGLAQGFPVAGGMSQSAVNDMGGASSPAALLVTSLAVALTLLFLAGFFHDLPEPVLGAIVLMAAKHLVRIEDLRNLRKVSRGEYGIALLAFVGVLCFGILDGILLAAVGSLVRLIAIVSRPPIAVLGRDPATGLFFNRALRPGLTDAPGVLVLRVPERMIYFNADHIRRAILELVDGSTQRLLAVILDFSVVSAIDVTAGSSLRSLARALRLRGVVLALAGLRDELVQRLRAVGAEEELGQLEAHRTIEACLEALPTPTQKFHSA
ncbi:MAG TPA: SulP family inorganic anion transporter [Stellaceae bacterium]|nr:SulP family inorganic anion transporter [Stellaceae bacterium]